MISPDSAGIATSYFKPHSIRQASTSAVKKSAVSLQESQVQLAGNRLQYLLVAMISQFYRKPNLPKVYFVIKLLMLCRI